MSTYVLESLIINHLPANYQWQVNQALATGNTAAAITLAEAQTKAESYDFNARRLLATALLNANQTSRAVSVMLTSLDKAHNILGRDVYSRGFDPAADYLLLTKALTRDGRLTFATEMQRAAADTHWLPNVLDTATSATATTVTTALTATPPPTLRPINLQTFHTTPGAETTSAGGISFSRRATATGNISTKFPLSSHLWLLVRGQKAMGFGAMLKLDADGTELIRIYADSPLPRWISVPLPPSDSATIRLTAHFLNDAFDPISKADRNVQFVQAGITP